MRTGTGSVSWGAGAGRRRVGLDDLLSFRIARRSSALLTKCAPASGQNESAKMEGISVRYAQWLGKQIGSKGTGALLPVLRASSEEPAYRGMMS